MSIITTTAAITIALADDEHLFLKGLEGILNEIPEFKVVHCATDGSQLLREIKAMPKPPDVIILDLRMKPMNGMDAAQALKTDFPEQRIIILSTYYREAFLGYMIKLGVSAFLPKNIAPDELMRVIHKVHEKGLYLTDEHVLAVREQIVSGKRFESPAMEQEVDLTRRELEVLKAICDQKTSGEIAEELFVSIRTVEGHRNNLLLKTGAKNTVGLVMFALLNNIVNVEEKLIDYSLG